MVREKRAPSRSRCRQAPSVAPILGLALIGLAPAVFAQPVVVTTAEGQIGETPAATTKVLGARFESIRGQAKEILLGGTFVFGGTQPPPPELSFVTDRIHSTPSPTETLAVTVSFDDVFKLPPASARARNAADDGDFVAFSFAADGSMPDTLAVRLVTFDETGSSLATITLDDIPSFTGFPDPEIAQTGVAVDNQGRATVVYTRFDRGAPQIRAARFEVTGPPINLDIPIIDPGVSPDVALLDPIGDKVVVVSGDVGSTPPGIRGNIVDFSGPGPVVLPTIAIDDTTAAVGDFNPAVAADPATGAFVVAWENVTGMTGDPVNVRARRFDANGNPAGPSFQVNSTSADAQGQPALAMGPGGELVVVWAGDPLPGGEGLEVFAQAYDAAGNPIGGEIPVNTDKTGDQDKPTVRFLPEPDSQGRPQFAVVWRDVETAPADGPARGTGQSFKCFSIDNDPALIFSDGFESGDTSSWSAKQPD